MQYVKKNNDGFENLVDELPLGMLSCDREGNITAVNDFLLKILGSPSADATKKINILTFPPLLESGISSVIGETLRTGKNSSIETPYRSKWGKELFLSFKAFSKKSEYGRICGCYAIVEDLTNRRKATLEFEQNKRKDNLISKISSRFINSNFKEIDDDINKALKDLTYFVGADCVAVFSVDENTSYIVKTHEWCIDGVVSKIPLNEKWDTEKIVFKQLSNLQIISILDTDKIPEKNTHIREILQDLEIKSIAMIPLSRYGAFKNFIGVYSKNKRMDWNDNALYVLKIVGDMIANILDRQNTEGMLLKKEEEYEEIIHSIDSIIWKVVFDKEGNTLKTYIAEPVDRILGLPDGTIATDWDKYFDHIHPEDLQRVMDKLELTFKNPGTSLNEDYRMLTGDGKIIWMNSTGNSYLQDDGTFLTYGTSVNITERKMAEEEISRSEKKYRFLIEQSNDAIFLNRLDGQIVEVNDKACEMLSYPREELLKMNVIDLLTPELIVKGLDVVERLRKEDQIQGNTKYITGGGYVIDVEVNAKILEGYPDLAQAVVRDITERKMAENKLRESEALLNEVGRIVKIGGWELNVASGTTTLTPEVARIHETDKVYNLQGGLGHFPQGSREILEKAVNDAVEKCEPYDYELEFISVKGNHK
ncbi:PAS domain S-box protein [Methanolobus sp. ZRKC5]|uniref:PAS domain S-box protein n=1 Tax=unclassified Methanolobus TaxID=2629569 RepID=UPI00313E47C7